MLCFRRTLVGLKRAYDGAVKVTEPSFRRTLVGLKHGRGEAHYRHAQFQTYPRGVEARRGSPPPSALRRFRRTLVGLKQAAVAAEAVTMMGFRRTLVGLKHVRLTPIGDGSQFQTYPRGVEAATSGSTRRSRRRFQTYPRGVEAPRST